MLPLKDGGVVHRQRGGKGMFWIQASQIAGAGALDGGRRSVGLALGGNLQPAGNIGEQASQAGWYEHNKYVWHILCAKHRPN